MKTKKIKDVNGWVEIKANPISKVGVFQYSGRQIDQDGAMGLDPDKIYSVYRSEEELSNPETIESFKLVPWTIEHEMLGAENEGLTPPEKKGIHGVVGEEVFFEYPYLKGNIKIFSDELSETIYQDDKKELSIGYRCDWKVSPGVYKGEAYDVIQFDLRGNHLATVEEGRAGPDVAVLDYLKFTFDTKEITMGPDTKVKDEEMTLEKLAERFTRLEEMVTKLAKAELAEDEDEPKATDEEKPKAEDEDESKAEDEDESKAEDEDESKAEDEDKTAVKDKMQAMDAKLNRVIKAVDSLSKGGIKSIFSQISRRDVLAQQLSAHIGTFDHAEKTLSEVAEYGAKKLGIHAPKGQEYAAITGFLAAKKDSIAYSTGFDSAYSANPILDLIDGE